MATATSNERVPVPRDRENDYTREAAAKRQGFVRERTGSQRLRNAPGRRCRQ